MDSRLIVKKIIYAKSPKMKFDFNKVIDLEVQAHLAKNPDLEFVKISSSKENPDLSITHELKFKVASKK